MKTYILEVRQPGKPAERREVRAKGGFEALRQLQGQYPSGAFVSVQSVKE